MVSSVLLIVICLGGMLRQFGLGRISSSKFLVVIPSYSSIRTDYYHDSYRTLWCYNFINKTQQIWKIPCYPLVQIPSFPLLCTCAFWWFVPVLMVLSCLKCKAVDWLTCWKTAEVEYTKKIILFTRAMCWRSSRVPAKSLICRFQGMKDSMVELVLM